MKPRSESMRWIVGWRPLVFLTLLWAVLYLPNLRTSPGWYGDETIAFTAAQNLLQGQLAHRAIWNTFWNPYAPYQPIYELLIGAGSIPFQGDIVGGRLLNALMALACALLMATYGRYVVGTLPALFAAMLFLAYEQSVIHFRWIFTHNMVAMGFLITFLALCRKPGRRTDLTAGVGLAISAGALPLFVYGALPAGSWRLRHPKSWLFLVIPPIIVVGGSLALGYFWHLPNQFLWQDLQSTADFYSRASAENSGSIAGFAVNMWRFFTQDLFHVFGFLSLCFSFQRRSAAIAFGGLAVACLLLQNRQNLVVFYYQAVTLLPLMIMAMAVATNRCWQFAARRGVKRPAIRRLQLAVLLLPLAMGAFLTPSVLRGTLQPRNHFWTTQSPAEVEQAARWINSRVKPGDLVICHHNIAWLIRARTADYLMATTWEGLPTWPFKEPLPREQFAYPADLSKAKYAVVADIDHRWTIRQPNAGKVFERLATERWPLVWSGEFYQIYLNPRLSTPTP